MVYDLNGYGHTGYAREGPPGRGDHGGPVAEYARARRLRRHIPARPPLARLVREYRRRRVADRLVFLVLPAASRERGRTIPDERPRATYEENRSLPARVSWHPF